MVRWTLTLTPCKGDVPISDPNDSDGPMAADGTEAVFAPLKITVRLSWLSLKAPVSKAGR